jgi:hypothetical protein
MQQDLIFLPMAALAALTFVILGFIPQRRFRAVAQGLVGPNDFALGESKRVPGDVAIPNRNYMNLLEAPLLFYVAGLMYYVAGRLDHIALVVAWLYVGLRVVHSFVHMTSNNIRQRLAVFGLSNFVLMAFWILFFV